MSKHALSALAAAIILTAATLAATPASTGTTRPYAGPHQSPPPCGFVRVLCL